MAMNLATQTVLDGDTAPGSRAASGQRVLQPAEIAGLFPQFEILECLGRGGMGVVYKARQKSLNRLVALKILAPEREQNVSFAKRFALEAETLAKLDHPNIVAVHDFGEAGGMFYLVMEFVDGVNLQQLISGRRISPREALAIVPQICDALQFAHDRGVVHRDIKPENILLDRRGRVKVADFGLAKLVGIGGGAAAGSPAAASSTMTEAGKIMGTPPYMAPEQFRHPAEVDHRVDIYGLGVVLYQMLTGELPGKQLEPPSRKVQIDVRLDEVVLRALEKDPGRRYTQASVLKTELETIAGSEAPTPASAEATAEPSGNLASLRETAATFTQFQQIIRWGARVVGTLWGLGFLWFILSGGFPLIGYAAPVTPPTVQAGFAALILAGLALGWRREGAGAALILIGWTLLFASERYPFRQLWLYAPILVCMLYFWVFLGDWILGFGVGKGNSALQSSSALLARTGNCLMWMGIVGVVITIFVQCRGYGNGFVGFALIMGKHLFRLPLPPGLVVPAYIIADALAPLYLLLIIGGWHIQRRRNYPVALISSVLAMGLPPLLPVALPLGIWAWMVLRKQDVKQEFLRAENARRMTLAASPPRFSTLAFASAVVAVLPCQIVAMTLALVSAATTTSSWQVLPSLVRVTIAPWLSPFAGFALAWVAWENVRISRGHLRAAGLIVFTIFLITANNLIWWLRLGTPNDAAIQTRMVAYLAWSQGGLVLATTAGAWVSHLEAVRLRKQQFSSWWFFKPPVRWVIVALALLCLFALGFR
jgi:predicted Ser/Thr protein kinase